MGEGWRVESLRESSTDAFVRKMLEESIEKPKKRCFKKSIEAPNEDDSADPKEKRDQAAAKESSDEEKCEDATAKEEDDAAATTDENPNSSDRAEEGIPPTPEVEFPPAPPPGEEQEERGTPLHHLNQKLLLDHHPLHHLLPGDQSSYISPIFPLSSLNHPPSPTASSPATLFPIPGTISAPEARALVPSAGKGMAHGGVMVHAPDGGKKEEIGRVILGRYLDAVVDVDGEGHEGGEE